MLNKKLLKQTMAMIEANPGHLDQNFWHCETAHCFAGFVDLILHNIPVDTEDEYIEELNAGKRPLDERVQEELGLTDEQVSDLFYNSWDLGEVREYVNQLLKMAEEEG